MSQSPPRPTDAELEILQVLWTHGPATVRFVNDQLNSQRQDSARDIGYTTTLKLMQIMVSKGLAARDTEQRTHIYRALVREGEVQQALLSSFLDKTFRGSAARLVLQALGNHRASSEELAQIKALIDRMAEDRRTKKSPDDE